MITTTTWETLGDISRRTGIRGELVIDAVRAEFKAGLAVIKFDEDCGVKIVKFKAKEAA